MEEKRLKLPKTSGPPTLPRAEVVRGSQANRCPAGEDTCRETGVGEKAPLKGGLWGQREAE